MPEGGSQSIEVKIFTTVDAGTYASAKAQLMALGGGAGGGGGGGGRGSSMQAAFEKANLDKYMKDMFGGLDKVAKVSKAAGGGIKNVALIGGRAASIVSQFSESFGLAKGAAVKGGAGAAEATAKGVGAALKTTGMLAAILIIADALSMGLMPFLKVLSVFIRILSLLMLPLSMALIRFLKPLIQWLAPLLIKLAKAGANAPMGLVLGGAIAGGALGSVLGPLGMLFGAILGSFAPLVGEGIAGLIKMAADFLGTINFAGFFTDLFTKIGGFVLGLLQNIPGIGAIVSIITGIVSKVSELSSGIDFTKIGGWFSFLKDMVSWITGVDMTGAQSVFDLFKQVAVWGLNLAVSAIIDWWNSFVKLFAEVTGVQLPDSEAVGKAIATVVDILGKIMSYMAGIVVGAIDFAMGIMMKVLKGLVDFANSISPVLPFLSAGFDVIKSLLDAVAKVAGWIAGGGGAGFSGGGGAGGGGMSLCASGYVWDASQNRCVKAFQSGGVVENTGMAYLHAGEYVTPAGGGGGDLNITLELDGDVIARRVISSQTFRNETLRRSFGG